MGHALQDLPSFTDDFGADSVPGQNCHSRRAAHEYLSLTQVFTGIDAYREECPPTRANVQLGVHVLDLLAPRPIMAPSSDDAFHACEVQLRQMLRRSQTKVIFPLITLGLLRAHQHHGVSVFSDAEIRRAYEMSVREMKEFLGHDLHIGGKYYDAYPSRNLTKYGVLRALGAQQYQLTPAFIEAAARLCEWIPIVVQEHILTKLGVVPRLGDHIFRVEMSKDPDQFLELIANNIQMNPTNFEVFTFAVLKVHLEKFACKLYRDTRTGAHDSGVDISTNFGAVYQIKKLRVYTKSTADGIYGELKANFDRERIQDGNVIVIIDDISKDIRQYLIDMKVQTISRSEVLKMAEQFQDMEDREKVLRIIYDEFRREYSSSIA
jgi:hypothetical protein